MSTPKLDIAFELSIMALIGAGVLIGEMLVLDWIWSAL